MNDKFIFVIFYISQIRKSLSVPYSIKRYRSFSGGIPLLVSSCVTFKKYFPNINWSFCNLFIPALMVIVSQSILYVSLWRVDLLYLEKWCLHLSDHGFKLQCQKFALNCTYSSKVRLILHHHLLSYLESLYFGLTG